MAYDICELGLRACDPVEAMGNFLGALKPVLAFAGTIVAASPQGCSAERRGVESTIAVDVSYERLMQGWLRKPICRRLAAAS